VQKYFRKFTKKLTQQSVFMYDAARREDSPKRFSGAENISKKGLSGKK
jgi:hypothetical protein